MKKFIYLVIILSLAITINACSPSAENTASNPKLQDLEYFHETLEKEHKNLYANISKDEFQLAKGKIVENIDEMSDSDFYYSLKNLLSLVGDSHTTLEFSDSKVKHLQGLGFAVAKYGDGWYLTMLEKENEEYLGHKLLAINDLNISDVFNKAKDLISYDNETKAEIDFSSTINFRQALEYLAIIGESDPIVLKIEDGKGNNNTLEIKSMNEEEIMNAEIISIKPKLKSKTLIPGFYNAIPLDSDSFFIQYNVCAEDPNLSMEEFIHSVKDKIIENEYKKIIIDLRYNSGGNSDIFTPMIDELSVLQSEIGFNVYTVIGKYTFSSAIINAVQIKEELNSTLVGAPTAGSVNHFGEIKSFDLSNMPISVWYSTKYFEMVEGQEVDSLYPDIFVEEELSNYLNGIDKEVEVILNLEK